MRIVKRIISAIIPVLLLFSVCGCNKAQKTDYVQYGIETIKTVKNLIKDDDYCKLMNFDISNYEIPSFYPSDPQKVYSLTAPENEEFVSYLLNNTDDDSASEAKKLFSSLSQDAKEQILNRVTASFIISTLNSRYGSAAVLASNTFQVTKKYSDWSGSAENPKEYIFEYEDGICFYVRYSYATDYETNQNQLVVTAIPFFNHESENLSDYFMKSGYTVNFEKQ